MDIISAVCKIEKRTGLPAVFYYEQGRHMCGGKLVCYTLAEMHSSASISYYRKATHPPKSIEEIASVNSMMKHYVNLCAKHGEAIIFGKHLLKK